MTLKELRIQQGLTQLELAILMSTTQSSISRMEKPHNMKLSTLIRYINALGATLEIGMTIGGEKKWSREWSSAMR